MFLLQHCRDDWHSCLKRAAVSSVPARCLEQWVPLEWRSRAGTGSETSLSGLPGALTHRLMAPCRQAVAAAAAARCRRLVVQPLLHSRHFAQHRYPAAAKQGAHNPDPAAHRGPADRRAAAAVPAALARRHGAHSCLPSPALLQPAACLLLQTPVMYAHWSMRLLVAAVPDAPQCRPCCPCRAGAGQLWVIVVPPLPPDVPPLPLPVQAVPAAQVRGGAGARVARAAPAALR